MRNDPFFKTVQKNLTEMLKMAPKEDSSNSKAKIEEPPSAVKKKIF